MLAKEGSYGDRFIPLIKKNINTTPGSMAISSSELNDRSEYEAPRASSCGTSVGARPDDGPLD